MSIVRLIMIVFPYAWVLFIVCTTFTVLNLFVGIIASAMTAEGEAAAVLEREKLKEDQETIINEIRLLRQEIQQQKAQSSLELFAIESVTTLSTYLSRKLMELIIRKTSQWHHTKNLMMPLVYPLRPDKRALSVASISLSSHYIVHDPIQR